MEEIYQNPWHRRLMNQMLDNQARSAKMVFMGPYRKMGQTSAIQAANNYNGIPIQIVPEEYLMAPAQFKFPRSKKVRIRKKWKKNKDNFRLSPHAVMVSGKMMVSQRMYEALKIKI